METFIKSFILFTVFMYIIPKDFEVSCYSFEGFTKIWQFGIHTGKLTDSDRKTTERSYCQCNTLCQTISNCTAYSIDIKEGSTTCQLSYSRDPVGVTTKTEENLLSFVGIKTEELKKLKKNDNYLYWISEEPYTFDEALDLCNSIPGFRLAIIKTSEGKLAVEDLIKEYKNDFWVDLKKIDDVPTWGDGEPFDYDGPLGEDITTSGNDQPVYIFSNSGLKDRYSTDKCLALCQGKIDRF
ncbi:UNVERIFIED_CONTAM: hypothetical protein RMT77_012568 [Armadillidium vulgare]